MLVALTSLRITFFKDRNKSRDLRLLISANHEIISTPDFAVSVLNEEATVLDV